MLDRKILAETLVNGTFFPVEIVEMFIDTTNNDKTPKED